MNKHSVKIAAVALLICVSCVALWAGAQPLRPHSVPLAPCLWSDPATWNGRVPKPGQDVEIPRGKTVVLDVVPVALHTLSVNGTLIFQDRDLSLTAESVVVGGRLEVGSPTRPFEHRATITLTGRPSPQNVDSNTIKILHVMNGDLEMYGRPTQSSWTHLAQSAPIGAQTLTLDGVTGWHTGDEIVIAATDFDCQDAETARISRVSGRTVSLTAPLRHPHWGQVVSGVDERAEVGLLSHNIVVQGDPGTSRDGYGGQVMVMGTGHAHLENAEFRGMGQIGRLGRYPLHFHLLGNHTGILVKNCSIHHCYNRCLTIHGTSGARIDSNVCYDTIGHCYFFEDGTETNNLLQNNLGILTRRAHRTQAVLPSDLTPATFWITNPNNIVRGNVAAGSEYHGFWVSLPKHPTGLSRSAQNDRTVWPRRTALGEFSGNVAHSNVHTGVFVDNGPNPPGVTEAPNYEPLTPATFTGITAYKNRRRGVWMRGINLHVTHARLADNAIGITLAASQSSLSDSLIVGETANRGRSQNSAHRLQDRSLPKPEDPHFPIRGFEFYDGLVSVHHVTFVDFQPDRVREASALSYLRFTPFFIDQRNFVENLHFVRANRVYFDAVSVPKAMSGSGDGYRSALFYDKDGSVCGEAGRFIVVRNPFLAGPSARFVPAWNAYVSREPYCRLFIDDKDPHPAGLGPVTLVPQNAPHNTYQLWGVPGSDPSVSYQTTLIADRAYAIRFHGPGSAQVRLTLRGLPTGRQVTLTLPRPPGRIAIFHGGDRMRPLTPACDAHAFQTASGAAYLLTDKTVTVRLTASVANSNSTAVTITSSGAPTLFRRNTIVHPSGTYGAGGG